MTDYIMADYTISLGEYPDNAVSTEGLVDLSVELSGEERPSLDADSQALARGYIEKKLKIKLPEGRINGVARFLAEDPETHRGQIEQLVILMKDHGQDQLVEIMPEGKTYLLTQCESSGEYYERAAYLWAFGCGAQNDMVVDDTTTTAYQDLLKSIWHYSKNQE